MKESGIIIYVYGLVQGVFFRYATRKFARKLDLTGYVKNLSNGSVIIEAEGPREKLEKLLAFSKKGPRNARVDHVEFEFKTPKHQYKGFDYAF